MSSRLQRILLAAALLTVLGARGVFAALPETLPAGMGKYIMALWPAGTPVPGEPSRRIPAVPEPDVAKLGGKVLDTMGHRRVIVLPLAAAEQLARHDAVAYLQRVWMGEALDGWSASESSADELLKADSNDGPTATWGPATYAYDGDGNIRSITRPTAADTYVYDDVGRLVQATVKGQTETYKYDAFGNLTEKGLVPKPAMAFGVDAGSNRLIGHEYDAAGNILTRSEKSRYEYDSLNMAVYTPGAQGQEGRRILYDASDERLGTVMMGTTWRWTIRDFQGQVLREYFSTNPFQTWEWQQDHIRGEGHLIAGEGIRWKYNPSTNHWGGGRRHYHLDHLGSVRMVSDEGGRSIAEHDYYPFGATQTAIWQEQLIPGNQNNDGMRFAGHWRDYLGYVDAESPDYLDSMHARYYDPQMGRFLSVDPVLDTKKALKAPQMWNRYTYVLNNPLRYVDPDGRQTAGADGSDPDDSGHGMFGSSDIVNVRKIDQIMMATLDKINDVGVNLMMMFAPIKAPPLAGVRTAVLLGENMARVGPAAGTLGAQTFTGTGKTFAETMAMNMKWLAGQVKSGARILDIGLDASRGGRTGVFYKAEVAFLEKAGYTRQFVKLVEVDGKTYRMYEWVQVAK